MKHELNIYTLIILSFTLVTLTTGCSALRSTTQTVNVACNPQDAFLSVNGEKISNPSKIEVPRNKSLIVSCNKSNYYDSIKTVSCHFNSTGTIDAIAGVFLIVPLIGVACPGAWSLDETDIFVQLYEIK